MERHQYPNTLIHLLSRRILERVQQRTFTTRKVFTCCPHFADRFKHLLHQQVLVGNERVVIDKFDVVAIVRQLSCRSCIKRQLVAQDIAFLNKQLSKLVFSRFCFFEQTLLDDFVGIGRGEGDPGMKTSLDF